MAPLILEQDPQPDPVRDAQALAVLPSSADFGMGQALLGAPMLGRAFGFSVSRTRDLFESRDDNPTLDPEALNARYAVEGYLKFERPESLADAEFKSFEAHQKAFREAVLANTAAGPLQLMGAGLAGGIFDPVALPLFMVPELTVGRAVRQAWVAGRAGLLANAGRGALITGGEGLAGAALYEAANYGLSVAADDEYDLGAGLGNLVAGAVLGSVLGGLHGALEPHGGPRVQRAPRVVDEMTDNARLGATVQAIDTLAGDDAVRVGALVEAEARAPRGLEHLDEAPDLAARGDVPMRSVGRDADVAVTTRGTEVPVRYGLMELDHLVTSHTDDLSRNPAYPEELQPRQRDRAGAQARNLELEKELNPRRLMVEAGAETGAPIVSQDGVVESGNGRTIALRRSAGRDGEAWGRYQAELKRQGFDVEGMRQPVLVRMRTEPMTGDARAALTREMNADVTERLSAPEQAMSDAAGIDDAALAHLDGTPAGERAFAQRFPARVASDQQNAFADAGGRLSAEGQRRIRAALVAKAYGDPSLVSAIYESADPNIRTIGAALAEAAPAWARMRAAAARGEIPAELDITANLRAAVDLVRYARDSKISVGELIEQRLGQVEMFGGEAISVETEALLRLMFRDEHFRRHRAADKIAWALDDYARQSGETRPGPNLFGETPDGESRLILQALEDRFRRDEPFPGQADLAELADHDHFRPAPGDAGQDLPPLTGERPGPDVQQEGGGAPVGDRQGGPGGPERPVGAGPEADAFAADPALKALAEDTEAFAAEAGLDPPLPHDDPKTIAEAIRAAAVCLKLEEG